jgi:hypothetical protein
MTEDDDMNYPMINLLLFEKFGEEFLTEHIIQTWMENFPSLSTFTAERVAYANTIAGFNPPETALIRKPIPRVDRCTNKSRFLGMDITISTYSCC